jgi:hypothetical protein
MFGRSTWPSKIDGSSFTATRRRSVPKRIVGGFAGRVDLGGRPPRPPTDPDLPVKEASGSSSHDFATLPTRLWTTRARGRLYRSSRRANRDHVIGLPRRRRDNRRLQIPRASSRNCRRL